MIVDDIKEKADLENPSINPELIAGYGKAFWGAEVDMDKLKYLFIKGIVPEWWIKDSGFSNGSYDSVCITALPFGISAKDRLLNMTVEQGNLNSFIDEILNGTNDNREPLTIGILLDLEDLEKNEEVSEIRINGIFDEKLFPTDRLPGIKKMKRHGGGKKGEVRITMQKQPGGGITADKYWKGIIINSNLAERFQEMIDSIKKSGVMISPVPVFNENMELLFKT